jgi:hypothetical protein
VIQDKTTNYQPVITLIQTGGGRKPLTKLRRRNFKSIGQDALEEALNIHEWAGIYSLKDMEEVHRYIVRGMVEALDVVAPIKEIVVKTGSNLYLTEETLEMMKRRDTAKVGTRKFCALRNAANRLVKRDKLATNAETLAKSRNDPCVLWQLANTRLAKPLHHCHPRSSTRLGVRPRASARRPRP